MTMTGTDSGRGVAGIQPPKNPFGGGGGGGGCPNF